MKGKRIKRIEWMGQDTDMLVTFEENKANLSYDSRIVIPANLLNGILCDLKKENIDFEPNNCLKIEQWSINEVNFVFDFTMVEVNSTLLFQRMETVEYRYIRA